MPYLAVTSFKANGQDFDTNDPVPDEAVSPSMIGAGYVKEVQILQPQSVDATPKAEQKATSEGVNLADVEGSGKEGRVVTDDVEEVIQEKQKPVATEAAEKRANELGVLLSEVEGSGNEGRITLYDVEHYAKENQKEE